MLPLLEIAGTKSKKNVISKPDLKGARNEKDN